MTIPLLLALSSCTAALTFDYVIVGGGPAGLTVANRLSEDSSVTVAVIEAGTFPEDVVGNISQVPAYVGYLSSAPDVYNTDIEWAFFTTPQPVSPPWHVFENKKRTDLIINSPKMRLVFCILGQKLCVDPVSVC
jgi:choline dehydrogenase-like flavoprotein